MTIVKKEAEKVEYIEKIPDPTSRKLNVLEKIARREGLTVDLPTPDKLAVVTSGAWFTMLALRDHEDSIIKIIVVSLCIAAMLGIGLLWYFCCCLVKFSKRDPEVENMFVADAELSPLK